MDRSARALGVGLVAVIALAVVAALTSALAGDPERTAAPSGVTSLPSVPSSSPPSPTPSEPPGPPLLPPNMRSLNASDLQIQGTGQRRLLRFSASLANLGPGPLLLRPVKGTTCPREQHPADQLLHVDGNEDGVYQEKRDPVGERREVGCMLAHPDHDHWHFDAMAAYALRRPGSTTPMVSRDKVSFCLRDNVRVPGQPVVVRREHFGECSRRSRQGISPGWVDIYTFDLSGQTLRLPRGVDGQPLCLDLEADPLGLLVEADETDNATSVGIVVDGRRVRRTAPGRCR